MAPAGTFAIVTFATGMLLLMAWLYATLDNPRSGAILKKSLLLFILPMLFWPGGLILRMPFGIGLAAACEEGLKAFASTREQNPKDKFWLVALFGIWELTLDKPVWGLVVTQSGGGLDRLSLIGLVYATALPVLMHTITAAIYAFTFERRLWAAFITSWVVHATFNETVVYFAPSADLVFVQTVILGTVLAAVVLCWRQRSLPENS
jgi:hypothetical protein